MAKLKSNKSKKRVSKKKFCNSENIKLDQILKLLFDVSPETTINALNGLFNENYDPKDVDIEIEKDNNEFILDDLSVIKGDTFIRFKIGDKLIRYHIEYQLGADGSMVLRTFKYDMSKAIESSISQERKTGEYNLYMPKSIVIHFTKSDKIPDKYKLNIIFADGSKHEYYADVMKYWEYSAEDLISKKLYNLLPLQVFLLRDELDKATVANDENSRQSAIDKAWQLTCQIAKMIDELNKKEQFNLYDTDKLLIGVSEIFKHLNDRYAVKKELNEEADIMFKTLYDENVAIQKAKEIAKNLLGLLDTKTIAEKTGLSEEQVIALK